MARVCYERCHDVTKRRRQAIWVIMILVVGFGAASLIPGVRHLIVSSNNDKAFALMNHDRTANSPYPALAHQAQLDAYAQNWSNHMAQTGVLAHDSIDKHICCWDVLGENVGEGSTLEGIEQAFMKSPEHRRNILYPTFTQVGIGVTYDAKKQVYFVTQAFRDPSSAASRQQSTPKRTVASRPATKRTVMPQASTAPMKSSVRPSPSVTPSVFVPSPVVAVQSHRAHHHRSALIWVIIGILIAFIVGMVILIALGLRRRSVT
jgi:predicted nucleic acid-binding Zn ribbon protein